MGVNDLGIPARSGRRNIQFLALPHYTEIPCAQGRLSTYQACIAGQSWNDQQDRWEICQCLKALGQVDYDLSLEESFVILG